MAEIDWMPKPNSQANSTRRKEIEKCARPATAKDLKWVGDNSIKIIDVTSKTVLKPNSDNSPRSTTEINGATRLGTYVKKIEYPFEYQEVPDITPGTGQVIFQDSVTEPGIRFHITGDQGENYYSPVTKARYCLTQTQGAYKLTIWNQENNPHTIPIEVQEVRETLNKLYGEYLISKGYHLLGDLDAVNEHLKLQAAIWANSPFARQLNQLLLTDLSLEEVSNLLL